VNEDTARFRATELLGAVAYAAAAHADHARKGSDVPYISHLFFVAATAMEYGATLDQVRAALLHDVIEDGHDEARVDNLREAFGGEVFAIVEACTDTDENPKPPWKQRKERYIEHLRSAPPRVWLVAAADKLANVESMLRDLRRHDAGELWSRFNAGRDEQLWYQRAVLEALGAGEVPEGLRQLLAELAARIGELEARAR
jgi:(p)ppGpp synthase/HD superfamily hydrolase